MDPSSPEAQAILQYYNVTYDDVIFYHFHHQIGKYVSRLVLADKTLESFTDAFFSHIVASRRCHRDALGPYHDDVSVAQARPLSNGPIL